jgi:hypothetical protein
MSFNPLIFGACGLLLGGAAILADATLRLPQNNQGYAPEQPIAFSHRLHAGELQMDCQYCHHGARRSRHAGVPAASVCMNCHGIVTSGLDAALNEKAAAEAAQREPEPVVSAELSKLYDALALDADMQRDPAREETPIEWVRVHNLPDFVYFDHRVHVARDIACETCHGPVQSMERMRQHADLSMGWCIDCHRSNRPEGHDGADLLAPGERVVDHVSTNCVTCHL